MKISMIFISGQVLGSAKFCFLYSKLKFQLDESENKNSIFSSSKFVNSLNSRSLECGFRIKKSCLNQMTWLIIVILVIAAGQGRLFLHRQAVL